MNKIKRTIVNFFRNIKYSVIWVKKMWGQRYYHESPLFYSMSITLSLMEKEFARNDIVSRETLEEVRTARRLAERLSSSEYDDAYEAVCSVHGHPKLSSHDLGNGMHSAEITYPDAKVPRKELRKLIEAAYLQDEESRKKDLKDLCELIRLKSQTWWD